MYIACGYTDLRRGIDGLAGLVKSEFDLDPFQEAIFLFCGRRRDRIKVLYWEGDGFVLLYKALLNRKLMYTKYTRAQDTHILIGSLDYIDATVKNNYKDMCALLLGKLMN